jgi:fumarate reductase subunit C
MKLFRNWWKKHQKGKIMLRNILKVKSLITLSLTLAVIALGILSVIGQIDVNHLTQNPLIICIISAFTASYTSLYVNSSNKSQQDDNAEKTQNQETIEPFTTTDSA